MTYTLMILLNLILGGQPYSLTIETASPQLIALCRLDDNCMDLEEVNKQEGCGGDLDCCQRAGNCDEDIMESDRKLDEAERRQL